MYQIMQGNNVIAYTEEILYIKKHTNGCYVEAPLSEATGIAVNSTPYHLEGLPNTGMEDLPTVNFLRINAAEMLSQQDQIRADVDYISVMTGVELV